MGVDLKTVKKDFSKLKKLAKKEIGNQRYGDALNLISCAASLAYHLNFTFSDDDLEDYLRDISSTLLNVFDYKAIEGRWVFYDVFGFDNRGLTQQYITALEDWGVEFLYILDIKDSKSLGQSNDIIHQLKNCNKATVYILNSELSYSDKLTSLKKVIDEYRPEKAFLHLAPWSSLAVVLWNSYENSINRYFINLTDHAFWLGKGCLDYCIEFRDYGYFISRDFRQINPKKLLMQEFYPILKDTKFLGFPEQARGKKIIFSGGTYYKILGFNNIFFRILKSIIEKNPEAIILFAGSGDSQEFENFIKDNRLGENIALLGYRSDINEVIKHCDLFLNTFPVGGGLLLQYALINKKLVVSYGDKLLDSVNPEGWNNNIKFNITFYDVDKLSDEVYKLLHNQKYKVERELMLENIIITPKMFNRSLQNHVDYNSAYKVKHNMVIKDSSFKTNLYIENENKYLKQYDLIKFKWLGINYFKYDFFNASISLIRIIKNNPRNILIKINRKLGIKLW